MATDFFGQFLLVPSQIDPTVKADIVRVVDAIVSAYDAAGARHGVDPRDLALRRPLYLLTVDSDDGLHVLYSNENAVRGSTQWFFLGIRGTQALENTGAALMAKARREIGLNHWKAFLIPRAVIASVDHESLTRAIAPIAEMSLLSDLEDELRRRRIVQINPFFTGRNFVLEPDLCFVLMPFEDRLLPVFQDHIKPTAEGLGLRCLRADDIFRNTAIIEDIWEQINKARVVLADLTNKNPNVFYEVGISHTVGKDVVLMTQSLEDVPFDLRHLRCIQYDFTPRGMHVFQQQLRNTLVTLTGFDGTSS